MILKEKKILLGISGGIAAYKAVEILRVLQKKGAQIKVFMSSGAEAFISPLTFEALTREKVFTQQDFLQSQGGIIPHIDGARWAEAILVAPATASFISALAQGEASSLLVATIMASKVPVVICPAMNQYMWEHPATQKNVKILEEFGYHVLYPEKGFLACGEKGPGRLVSQEMIVAYLERVFSGQDLKGLKVLVTAGPTREPLDKIRYISNRSSGLMGVSLAYVAWLRGAEVTLVHGPLSVSVPQGLFKSIYAETANDMLKILKNLFPQVDILIMAAAVGDFKAQKIFSGKIKKGDTLKLCLVKNPDILKNLSLQKKSSQILVGFAAEEGKFLREEALRKLEEKDLDLIVANDITKKDTGFDSKTNEVLLLDRDKKESFVPLAPKRQIAWSIWDKILYLYSTKKRDDESF